MEGVQFEEEQFAPAIHPNNPLLVSLVLRTGIAKTPETAQLVLLGLSAVLMTLAAAIFIIDWNTPQFESGVYPEGYLNDPDYMQKYGNAI